ncbi:MAG: NAD(P)H-dependent oxidoreductase subunit E [Chloroflexi bacterium]|nr:NAD(P)H-dependent oxidoreductase subunit E [Chloroflexota bacterium]
MTTREIELSLLDPVLERHRGQQDALITMLQEMQTVYAYLPEQALERLSRETKIPLSRIYAVATFYAQFYLTPRGRNTVRICRGTACHVQRSELIITAAEDTLGIKEGETSDDLQFSIETVACLGTCFLAPVMMINQSYHGHLDPQKTRTILQGFTKSRKEP